MTRPIITVCCVCHAAEVDGKWVAGDEATAAAEGLLLLHGYCPACYDAEVAGIDRYAKDPKALSSISCWMSDCPGPSEWTWDEGRGCYAATCECGETISVYPGRTE